MYVTNKLIFLKLMILYLKKFKFTKKIFNKKNNFLQLYNKYLSIISD